MGKYVMIEGPDGSGKTTVVGRLAKEPFPVETVAIREPGGTELGEHVRKIFGMFPGLPASVKFDLMFAVRSMIYREINPYDGRMYVSDRGFPSTFAYQISAEKEEKLAPAFWCRLASGTVRIPDVIIILDVDVETGIERMKKAGERDTGIKEFDHAGRDFKELVRAGYLRFAGACNGDNGGVDYWLHRPRLKWLIDELGFRPPLVRVIDTSKASVDEVYNCVLRVLAEDLDLRREFHFTRDVA